MPIYKYKSFEEAEKALWNFKPDQSYFDAVAELWRFANQLSPITYPRGIFKYRSIEEANKDRERWELAQAKKLRAERVRPFR